MRCVIAKVLQDEVVLLSREGEFRTVPAAWVVEHLPAGSGVAAGGVAAGAQAGSAAGAPDADLTTWTGRSIELPWPPPEAVALAGRAVAAAKADGAGRAAAGWRARLRPVAMRWGALAAAAVLVVALLPRALAPKDQALVAIDINPSLELLVDGHDRVTAAAPRNDDARRVLTGLPLRGLTLADATDRILGRVIALGYLAPGKDNVVLASVVPLRGGAEPDIAALQQHMAAQLQTAGLSGYVSARLVAAPVRSEAKQAGLSVNQELVRQALDRQRISYSTAALAAESPKEALKAAGLDVTTVFTDGERVGEGDSEDHRVTGDGGSDKTGQAGTEKQTEGDGATTKPAEGEDTKQPTSSTTTEERHDGTTSGTDGEGKESTSSTSTVTGTSTTAGTTESTGTQVPGESSTTDSGTKTDTSETESDD